MASDRPFARVYYIDLERDYPTIFRDDPCFATYVRLLSVAEAMWPAVPEVPRSAKSALVKRLTTAGLVILIPPFGFRIKGMDAERRRRSDAARIAAEGRWRNATSNADGIAEGHAPEMPSQTSPDQSNTNPAEPSHGGAFFDERFDEPEAEAMTWLAKHGCYIKPGNGFHQHLVLAVERHGIDAVIGMFDRLARAGVTDGDIKGFVFGASDALKPKVNLREIEEEDRAEERDEARRNRKPDPLQVELAKQIAERYGPGEVGGPGVVKGMPS